MLLCKFLCILRDAQASGQALSFLLPKVLLHIMGGASSAVCATADQGGRLGTGFLPQLFPAVLKITYAFRSKNSMKVQLGSSYQVTGQQRSSGKYVLNITPSSGGFSEQ